MSAERHQLLPLPTDQWSSKLAPILNQQNGAPINVHRLMAHNPDLLSAWWNFRNHSVGGGTLGKRLAEILILRVSVHLRSWYEWGSHVDRALSCQVSSSVINRILQPKLSADLRADEGAILLAVDELMEQRSLSVDTQTALSRFFTSAQMLDIIAIHGMYMILGSMISTWGLELDEAVVARIAPYTSEAQFAAAAQGFHEAANV